jgi:hypothetical protein
MYNIGIRNVQQEITSTAMLLAGKSYEPRSLRFRTLSTGGGLDTVPSSSEDEGSDISRRRASISGSISSSEELVELSDSLSRSGSCIRDDLRGPLSCSWS